MPRKDQTAADAIRLFLNAKYPNGLTDSSAWLGVYQVLLWYEKIGVKGISSLPHLIDSDKLRPSASRKRKRGSSKFSAWQKRAKSLEAYLAQQLNCSPNEVESHMNGLFKLPVYRKLQRQNPLGIVFPVLVRFILEKFGNPAIKYELEIDATKLFPGITMPGRSRTPSIDILATKSDNPLAIISAKWSIRHDRIGDLTSECPEYKAAAIRRRLSPFYYFVVTNEFDPARLGKVLHDSCIDGLIHVHKPAVQTICELNGRLDTMLDLTDLILRTKQW